MRRPHARTRNSTLLALLLTMDSAACALRVGGSGPHNRRTVLCAFTAGCISQPAVAASTTIAALYDAEAATYDSAYSGSVVSRAIQFDKLRESVTSKASGAVLELGVGTGLNLPLYKASAVSSVFGIDVSAGMLEQAQRRVAALPIGKRVQLELGDASALPFDNDRFDTVVDTFSLCVFEKPGGVLAEAKRVLKPGGRLIVLEHDDSPVSRAMAFTRGTSSIASTCAYDQDVLALVREAGLTIRETSVAAGGFLRQVVAEKPL
jgi:methyltransferase OMS1